jgi:hypothetical protein
VPDTKIKLYRARAAQLRKDATRSASPSIKREMIALADQYEELAATIEREISKKSTRKQGAGAL